MMHCMICCIAWVGKSSWRGHPLLLYVFVSHLRPMGLNVLGYHSHLLQRCHPAYGHEGSFHLSPVLALLYSYFFLRCKVSTLTTRQPLTRFPLRKPENKIPVFSRIELATSALVGAQGYLLDHSGNIKANQLRK